MEDIIKSIKATLYERTGNPFLFSFFIAWCIHNFRIFMIVLSDESLNSKLVKIDSYFESNFLINGFVVNYGCILHAIIAPLIYTLMYIFLLPYISIKINRYHFKKQKELLSAKQGAEELELLTVEKSRELRKSMVLLEGEYRSQIEKLEDENNALKGIIRKESNDQKLNVNPKIIDEPIKLYGDTIRVLQAFSGVEYRSVANVSEILGIHLDHIKYICNELELKKCLSRIGTAGDGSMSYSLDHAGRKYLIENELL